MINKLLKYTLALILFGVTFGVKIAHSEVRQSFDIKALATDFYLNQSSKFQLHQTKGDAIVPPRDCEDYRSCVDVACDYLGSLGCNEHDEIRAVGQACRGNIDGACVDYACQKLGSLGCNQMDEIIEVAGACRSVEGKCVSVACGYLGSLGCNEMSEIQEVTQACKYTDSNCIDSLCSRLGSSGCNEMSEIRNVAEACRGE